MEIEQSDVPSSSRAAYTCAGARSANRSSLSNESTLVRSPDRRARGTNRGCRGTAPFGCCRRETLAGDDDGGMLFPVQLSADRQRLFVVRLRGDIVFLAFQKTGKVVEGYRRVQMLLTPDFSANREGLFLIIAGGRVVALIAQQATDTAEGIGCVWMFVSQDLSADRQSPLQ